MHFPTVLVTLLSAAAMAAPSVEPRADVKSMAAAETWTMESAKRVCNKADTSCDWSFTVNAGGSSKRTPCAFTVKKSGNTPASRSPGKATTCGPYTVTSGWSGQFGENQGFTTLSVSNKKADKIVWPSYTDKQLSGGKTVKPNQSYPVQKLP